MSGHRLASRSSIALVGYLGTIRVPAVTRNVAFGGPGSHTLYLTTLNALYRVQLLSRGPEGRAK